MFLPSVWFDYALQGANATISFSVILTAIGILFTLRRLLFKLALVSCDIAVAVFAGLLSNVIIVGGGYGYFIGGAFGIMLGIPPAVLLLSAFYVIFSNTSGVQWSSVKGYTLGGILLWNISFYFVTYLSRPSLMGMYVYPETASVVVLAVLTALLSVLCFRETVKDFVRTGLTIGFLWFAVCLAFDLEWHSMSGSGLGGIQSQYYIATLLTFLMIPAVTVGAAYLYEKVSMIWTIGSFLGYHKNPIYSD